MKGSLVYFVNFLYFTVTAGKTSVKLIIGSDSPQQYPMEAQFRASALYHGYSLQDEEEYHESCKADSSNPDDVILYLSRQNVILQRSPDDLMESFLAKNYPIVISKDGSGALVGRSSTIAELLLQTGTPSISSLLKKIAEKEFPWKKDIITEDKDSRIFLVLGNSSQIGDILRLEDSGKDFQLWHNAIRPPVIMSSCGTTAGEALLLALSDYLTGNQKPGTGCQYCNEKREENEKEVVMIGIFITEKHPFLIDSLASTAGIEKEEADPFFFVYNEVLDYKDEVDAYEEFLQTKWGDDKAIFKFNYKKETTLAEAKNQALNECRNRHCQRYLHYDSALGINPGTLSAILSYPHEVIAPAISPQREGDTAFWRISDATTGKPAFSWDHKDLLNSANVNGRGIWHASCISKLYKIERETLNRLSSINPYSHSDFLDDPDMSFCKTLHESGIPMKVTTLISNPGFILNPFEGEEGSLSVHSLLSNPVIWNNAYIAKESWSISQEDVSNVQRPCPDVYDFPVFTKQFCEEVIELAEKTNNWSNASSKDSRKESGYEELPTVDQFLKDIGLFATLDAYTKQRLAGFNNLAYPHKTSSDFKLALIAKFDSQSENGLPFHHDAASVTAFINLAPAESYEGGEVEFSLKGADESRWTVGSRGKESSGEKFNETCIIKPEAGHYVLHPGRMTHPKKYHSVTRGTNYRIILHLTDM